MLFNGIAIAPSRIALAAAPEPSTLLDDLVAYWKMNEQGGNRADSVGSNTLTNVSVGTEAGKLDNSGKFIAANSEYLSIADNADLSFGNEDFAIAAWVYLESKAATGNILAKWTTTGDSREYRLLYFQTSDRFLFQVSSAGTTASATVTANNFGSPAIRTWYHVVTYHDAANDVIGILVNNGTADTAAIATGIFDGTASFALGCINANGTPQDFIDGRVSDVGVWGRVLTADERTELYNGGDGNRYPFDEELAESNLASFTAAALFSGSNPVIPVGTGADSDLFIREVGNVLYEPADTGKEYKTWYTGYNAGQNTDEKIHYAYSSDGESWTKSPSNPVIADRAEDPYVINVGGTYYLFAEDKAGGATTIKRWDSADGVTWTNGVTVLSPGAGGAWDDADVSSPVVWKEDSTWYMLYEGRGTGDDGVGLATSADGATWAKDGSNPAFLASDTSWAAPTEPTVPDDIVKDGSTYYLFYHGETVDGHTQSGVATSTNLTTWTDKATNPLENEAYGRTFQVQYINNILFYVPGKTAGTGSGSSDNVGVYRGALAAYE